MENAFTWVPMQEVALLFAAIFITMIPVLALLKAGSEGHSGRCLPWSRHLKVSRSRRLLLADGRTIKLPRQCPDLSRVLQPRRRRRKVRWVRSSRHCSPSRQAPCSWERMTYIGNAPNFMVRSICEERGIKMPSFIGYPAVVGRDPPAAVRALELESGSGKAFRLHRRLTL